MVVKVSDRINDNPALKTADVAIDAADVVLRTVDISALLTQILIFSLKSKIAKLLPF